MVASPDRIFRTGRSFQITKESLRVPKFYRVLRWKQVSYFHVNVKSARHTLMRHFWLEWLGRSDFRTFPTLESYMRTQIGERLGSTDPAEAASRFMTQYSKQLAPFDADRCGSHPALLHAFLAKPKYRVEYRDGQIIGRSEAL
jgi:hypothetical protein